jgi:hypothetical protein
MRMEWAVREKDKRQKRRRRRRRRRRICHDKQIYKTRHRFSLLEMEDRVREGNSNASEL